MRNRFVLAVNNGIHGVALPEVGPIPIPGLELPDWVKEAIAKAGKWLATVFSYGGKGITTNRLKGSGTEPVNGGWGLNPSALTSAATDTALFNPAPEARVAGTSTQQTTAANIPNDTYQVVATIQASATRAITEFGLFDTTTAAPATTFSITVSTAGATAVTVAANAGFPGAGTYYIQADTEVMAVTGGQATNTWTVTRGARGSTSATHAAGGIVTGGEACAGGNMFLKGDFAVINLANGDSIQFTAKLQYT